MNNLCLIVDPMFVRLPPLQDVTTSDLKGFAERLLVWNEALKRYNITIAVSKNCQAALKAYYRSALNETWLDELFARHLNLDTRTFYTACGSFLQAIFDTPFVEDNLRKLETNEFVWDIYQSETIINPQDYLDRMPHPDLRDCYRNTLANVTFARKNQVLPIADFQHVGVLTSYSTTDQTWLEAVGEEHRVLIRIKFVWSIDESVKLDNRETVEAQTHYSDDLPVLDYPTQLPKSFAKRGKFSRMIDAVDAAAEDFPRLVITEQARETAKQSSYENPRRIYDLLEGLVKVWLPIYLKNGETTARDAFFRTYAQDYASDESTNVQNKFASDYTVVFEGQEVFCGKHLKIGTGHHSVRINFEVVYADSNGEPHIVVARSGRHGRH